MAVRFMNVGETAVVWSHSKFAYGLAGRTHRGDGASDVYELPSESNVAYEITILHKVDMMESFKTILDFAQARKEQANDQYQSEWYNGAGKSRIKQAYERIAKDMEGFLQSTEDLPENVISTAQAIRIDALNNITAVLLRAREYHAAKAAAVAVLELDPKNFKALIRAAKASLLDPSSEFEEVEKALEAAAANAANDSVSEDVAKLKQEFERRKQAYESTTKQMYKKAFHGSQGKDSTSKEATAASSKTATDPTEAVTNPPNEPPNTEPWDWQKLIRNYVLPYGFQILLTLAMYMYLQYNIESRRRDSGNEQAKYDAATGGSEDEF